VAFQSRQTDKGGSGGFDDGKGGYRRRSRIPVQASVESHGGS